MRHTICSLSRVTPCRALQLSRVRISSTSDKSGLQASPVELVKILCTPNRADINPGVFGNVLNMTGSFSNLRNETRCTLRTARRDPSNREPWIWSSPPVQAMCSAVPYSTNQGSKGSSIQQRRRASIYRLLRQDTAKHARIRISIWV